MFSGATPPERAILRGSELEDGVQYTVEMVLSSVIGGWSVVGSVSLETNAPPSSGYLESSAVSVRMLSQSDGLTLNAVGWTDDANHLPLAFRFGYYRVEASVAG